MERVCLDKDVSTVDALRQRRAANIYRRVRRNLAASGNPEAVSRLRISSIVAALRACTCRLGRSACRCEPAA